MDTFGEAVARLRQSRGWSLRELARRAHVDPGHLSRIEAGRRPATAALAAVLDKVLRANGELVAIAPGHVGGTEWTPRTEGFGRGDAEALAIALLTEAPTPGNALRLAHEWMLAEPPQVYEVRAGRRIDTATVDHIEQRLQQLRHLDDHLGGSDSYAMVTTELTATASLLREASYTAEVGQRLLTVLGELCQLAGWVASDAGRHRDAERLYLAGARAAHSGGDTAGAANNLSSLAYQMANVDNRHDAAVLAQTAVSRAERAATATSRALLLERSAWAHARAGEARHCERALGDVETAYEQRQPDDDPPWVYWLDSVEIEIMAGRCWTELRRPLRAIPLLQRATAGYDDQRPRETSLYLSWLAESLIYAHEIEEAAGVASRALELARSTHSDRATRRIGVLRRELAPFRNNPAVVQFDELCAPP